MLIKHRVQDIVYRHIIICVKEIEAANKNTLLK